MKTTVIHLEGIESVLSTAGVEKKMCKHSGIHKVETNFMTGTATVYHDDSVTLAEIKQCVADCGYGCAGEAVPEHIVKPGDPPAVMAHAGHAVSGHAGHAKTDEHAGHTMPMPAAKSGEHAGHDMGSHAGGHATPTEKRGIGDEPAGDAMAAGEIEGMAHEMGHGGGMNMEGMVRDMRNRFYVTFLLAIPVFLYSPLFTDVFEIQLPLPFGLSNKILSFLLATPAILYGGWIFYIGAWRGLQNRVLNMAVLVTLSVLAGYIFSVAATFFFEAEVFYEAAALLVAFVLS